MDGPICLVALQPAGRMTSGRLASSNLWAGCLRMITETSGSTDDFLTNTTIGESTWNLYNVLFPDNARFNERWSIAIMHAFVAIIGDILSYHDKI